MKARTALLELLKGSHDWRTFFRSCSESSAFRLRTQTWQFCNELKDRGHKLRAEEVEDALAGLARELLPDAPAAQWDAEWAHELCKDAPTRLAKSYAGLSATEKEAVNLSAQDVWDERTRSASLDNNPAAFRAALKGWEKVGLDAMKWVGARGGAA